VLAIMGGLGRSRNGSYAEYTAARQPTWPGSRPRSTGRTEGILLTAAEAFGNCPKFIQRRRPATSASIPGSSK
jgi:hypothetical protein